MIDKVIENKILNRLTSIEFVVSEKCQNNCEYCYRVKKHNNSVVNYINPEIIHVFLNNFLQLFKLEKSYFKTISTELFGGDALLDYANCKKIIDICLNDYKFNFITIPTNARLVQELNEYDLKELLQERVLLSLSVDGYPADSQRQLSKYGKMLAYNEKINYEKLIKLSKKYRTGFHPMFSFKHPETWVDTFEFFLSYEIYPYLLEVRHPISKEQSIECVTQLARIRNRVNKKYKQNRALNTIFASTVPRGLGCSALTTLTIMPNGDVPFCHRVVDPPWVSLNLLTKEWDIAKHVSFMSGFHHSNHPVCMQCSLRQVCSGQCSGANYEYWGDPWLPINSICNYAYLKYFIFMQLFEDWKKLQDRVDYDKLKKQVYLIYTEDEINKIKSEVQNDKI